MNRYAYDEPWNDRLEIAGDAREDIERTEGYEACPVPEITEEEMDAHHDDWQARMGIDDPEPMGSLDLSDDGDALASADMGTDEDYGYFGEDSFLDGSYEE
jgi:hypothetical protein